MEMSEKLYINGIEFLHSQSFDPRAVYHTFPAIFKCQIYTILNITGKCNVALFGLPDIRSVTDV